MSRMRKGGSCLWVLIIVALIGILAVVVVRLATIEKEREDEHRAAETKPVEKTPAELQRECIDELLADKAPDLGVNPAKALADGSVQTMKRVREQTVAQHNVIKSRLKAAEEAFERLRGERRQLETKIATLKDEYEHYPDDEKVGDDLAQCDEDLETKRREILQEQANVKLLKDYDYRLTRETATLATAIRKCESDGRTIATAAEYDALKKELDEAHGASVAVEQIRRTFDGKTTDVSAGVAGEKAKKRERLEKYRRVKTSAEGLE